jgi:hypothetical protein
MQFDRHTIVHLVRPPDAPELSGQELEAVQDTRLASQADLRTQGYLVAAGPFDGQDDERLRGSGGSPAAGNSFPQSIRAAWPPRSSCHQSWVASRGQVAGHPTVATAVLDRSARTQWAGHAGWTREGESAAAR